MKIFLDTAEVDQITDGYKTGLVDGVTTNPTLILRSGRQQIDVIEEIYQASVSYTHLTLPTICSV